MQILFSECEVLPSGTLSTRLWMNRKRNGYFRLHFICQISLQDLQIDGELLDPQCISRGNRQQEAAAKPQLDIPLASLLAPAPAPPQAPSKKQRGRPRKVPKPTRVLRSRAKQPAVEVSEIEENEGED